MGTRTGTPHGAVTTVTVLGAAAAETPAGVRVGQLGEHEDGRHVAGQRRDCRRTVVGLPNANARFPRLGGFNFTVAATAALSSRPGAQPRGRPGALAGGDRDEHAAVGAEGNGEDDA
jgi:hypothetical protein